MLLITKSTGCTALSSTEPSWIPAGPPLGSMQRSLMHTGFLLWHVKMSANVWVSLKFQIIQEPNLHCCTKEQSVIALYAPTSFLTWALLTCWIADWIVQRVQPVLSRGDNTTQTCENASPSSFKENRCE